MGMKSKMRRLTYEDRFSRKYACWWKRGHKKYKRENRRKFRRIIKSGKYD